VNWPSALPANCPARTTTASGTSAVRAFSQQAPQLLSAFGPWGVVAGTAVAVAAPLIASLFQVGEAAEAAGVSVEEMTTAIEEANQRLIEGITGSLAQQLDEHVKLRTSIAETSAAERAAERSTLDNDELIRQSKNRITEALGFQIDKYKEIEELAAAEAAKRKLQTAQAIAVEKESFEKARLAREDAQAAVATERQKMAELLQQQEKASAELAILLAKRAELQKTVDARPPFYSPDAVGKADADRAQRQIDNPIFATRIQELQDQVNQIGESLAGFEGQTGTLRDLNVRLQEKINSEVEAKQVMETNITRLEQEQATKDFAARAKTVADKQEQQAKDLTEAVTQIETTTQAGEAAKQTIQQAAADGKITADESQRVAQATTQLIGQTQAGLANAGANTQQVIGMMRAFLEQEARNARELQAIQRQINQLFARIR